MSLSPIFLVDQEKDRKRERERESTNAFEDTASEDEEMVHVHHGRGLLEEHRDHVVHLIACCYTKDEFGELETVKQRAHINNCEIIKKKKKKKSERGQTGGKV